MRGLPWRYGVNTIGPRVPNAPKSATDVKSTTHIMDHAVTCSLEVSVSVAQATHGSGDRHSNTVVGAGNNTVAATEPRARRARQLRPSHPDNYRGGLGCPGRLRVKLQDPARAQ